MSAEIAAWAEFGEITIKQAAVARLLNPCYVDHMLTLHASFGLGASPILSIAYTSLGEVSGGPVLRGDRQVVGGIFAVSTLSVELSGGRYCLP